MAKKLIRKKTEAGTDDVALLFHAMYLTSIIDGSSDEVELRVVESIITTCRSSRAPTSAISLVAPRPS